MARVPYLEASDLSPEDQDLLKRRISLFQALVNSPNAARAFSGLGQFIRYGSKLDPRLRELAILRIASFRNVAGSTAVASPRCSRCLILCGS